MVMSSSGCLVRPKRDMFVNGSDNSLEYILKYGRLLTLHAMGTKEEQIILPN
jgi:hypothetical protein